MSKPKTSGSLVEGDPTTLSRAAANQPFRDLIPRPSHPKIQGVDTDTPREWVQRKKETVPPVAWLVGQFDKSKVAKPFRGITSDGQVIPDLYQPVREDRYAAPTRAMVDAAQKVLEVLSEKEKTAVCHDVDSDEYRIWSNPELYINPGGVRLDETTEPVREAIHGLIRASCSPAGYDKVNGACLTNGFLGHLVNGRKVLNEHSFNFRLFGTPSETQPWGYTFFGHHLCFNVFVCERDLVIGPTFFGAEPDYIDEGPHKGLRLFHSEEADGLKLMQSLTPELQKKAQIFESMQGDELPEDRWNPFDERHLGGAYQDNRVIPYEGVCAKDFTQDQRQLVLDVVRAFNECLPEGPLAARMALVEKHLDETYFCWFGLFGDHDPYYYRIQSPVALCEFDFHAGIFLTNTRPAKCHIHTINRLPNGNDYGQALLRQWKSRQANGHAR